MAGRFQILAHILRNPVIGYIVFILAILLKNIALFFGQPDQRAAEYPWVLRQLAFLSKGSIVLDVGCSESILSHALVMRGFRVVGLDLRDYPMKSEYIAFVKRDIVDTRFPDEFFDGIVVVSTIEHVGLKVYGQTVIDSDLDLRAIHELWRVLKPGGLVILTTPFVGNGQNRIAREEREYGFEGLNKLTKGLEVLKEEYFYPYHYHHTVRWIRFCRSDALRTDFADPGIACLVLRKRYP